MVTVTECSRDWAGVGCGLFLSFSPLSCRRGGDPMGEGQRCGLRYSLSHRWRRGGSSTLLRQGGRKGASPPGRCRVLFALIHDLQDEPRGGGRGRFSLTFPMG